MPGKKIGGGTILHDESQFDEDGFDIFSEVDKELYMSKGRTQEILSEIPVTDEGPIEFRVDSQGTEYFMTPFTRIEGSLQIVRSDGGAMAGGDDFSVCNLFPNSIWRQVECQING